MGADLRLVNLFNSSIVNNMMRVMAMYLFYLQIKYTVHELGGVLITRQAKMPDVLICIKKKMKEIRIVVTF